MSHNPQVVEVILSQLIWEKTDFISAHAAIRQYLQPGILVKVI